MTGKEKVVLITGANSGIGLELTKQYADQGWTVYAIHRHDTTPATLVAAAEQAPNIRAERMDVTKQEEIQSLAQRLRGTALDVLINNAGVAYDEHLGLQTQMFGTLDFSLGDTIYATNVRGPLMVTQAFIDHVKASAQKKVVCVSSTTGSLTHSLPGTGGIFYRSSKAALNRAMMSVAGAVKGDGVTLVLLHPGAVATERNLLAAQHYAKGQVPHFDLISPTLSAHHMITTIGQLKIADSGRFLNYDGSTAPW